MKLVILFVTYMFPVVAFATVLVPGDVPKNEPLQPPPVGIKANIDQNVEAGNKEPYWANQEVQKAEGSGANSEKINESRDAHGDYEVVVVSEDKSRIGLYILGGLLCISIGSFLFWKKYKYSKHD